MNHSSRNSRKQHERKFDRRGVRQLSRVVSEELIGMQAHLEAQKLLIEAIIRVCDIDQAVVKQLKRDAQAAAKLAEDEREGNDLPEVAGEIDQLLAKPHRSWWRRLMGRFRAKTGLPDSLTGNPPGDVVMVAEGEQPATN